MEIDCYIIYMPRKEYYYSHKEHCLQLNHKWYLKNKEYCSNQAIDYYNSNKDKIKARISSNYHKKRYREGERHLIENYQLAKADNFKGWILHHCLELTLDNEIACPVETLKRLDMYYNRPYFELIYIRRSEHTALHSKARWKAGD